MMPVGGDPQENRLDSLFQAYRNAVDDPAASPQFMPELWRRIEARRGYSRWFSRMAGGLVTAATAASLMLFVAARPKHGVEGFYQSTYLEVLADDHAAASSGYAEPVSVETDSESELAREML